MRLSIDAVFPFVGYHGCPSKCRIRVFEPEGEAERERPYVVIATEIEENAAGTSITNAAERIATAVWHLLERPLNGMTWVENYPDRALIGGRPMFKERFDIVEFDSDRWQGLKDPKWRHSSKEEIERLVGRPVR